MKKTFLFSMFLSAALFIGCNRENLDQEYVAPKEPPTELMGGAIIINHHPNVDIDRKNSFPEGRETSSTKVGAKSIEDGEQLRVNDYRFKLVSQMGTLHVKKNDKTYEAQASHVKILPEENGGYAFVSYNHKNTPNIGGLVVYKYTITGEQNLEEVAVDIEPVTSIETYYTQINAVDFDGQKLYIAGATDNPSILGFKREDPAFFMVMELDANKKFKPVDPRAIVQLTSYQTTSIRYYDNRIYITTGDGTGKSPGGLYIYDANDYKLVNTILGKQHARSVDTDENGIYLMQANHARITKYNLDGSGEKEIYNKTGEATQKDAKSEILAWGDYLFVSQNETGLRMLFNSNGEVNESLDAPNKDAECVGSDPNCWYAEEDVTNSVSMNSDLKKTSNGKTVQSDLLLLANGRQGLYWYDIVKDQSGKDRIVAGNNNSILKETGSANFVASKGNIVFVADGLGGLKVLYIGFNAGKEPPVAGDGCTDFMSYLYNGTSQASTLLPAGNSVFRANAHRITKQLFQFDLDGAYNVKAAADATLNYIDIKNETELFITYIHEGAGWKNALGYFVIPADANIDKDPVAEYNYWNTKIKPTMYTTKGSVNILNDEFTNGGIIFKYIRDVDKGGHMKTGNTYQIGSAGKKFKTGDRIVIFMCPDGWNSQNNRVEVTFDAGTSKQIFFMHKYFNEITNIPYATSYGDFNNVQMNSFYSADCRSMALCIEDWHITGTDVDFNDIIFSISDNLSHQEVSSFELPVWTIGEKIEGHSELNIVRTDEILKK